MARRKIPDEALSPLQKKKREQNEKYKKKKLENTKMRLPNEKVQPTKRLHLIKDEVRETLINKSLPYNKEDLTSPSESVENISKSNNLQPVSFPIETVKNKALFSWMDLLRIFTSPVSVSLLICIAGMTSYLIYQGLLFFSFVEINTLSATTNAIVSEVIPILSAACLTLCTHRMHKLAAGLILIVTIIGLSLFMHTSIAGHMTKQSSQFSRLNTDRNISLETIQTLNTAFKALPDTFLTKKQQIMRQIQAERDNLGFLNQRLNNIETSQSNIDPLSLSYSVWLRIAAMLMNTLLVHLFFSRMACLTKMRN